jgi:hypothetical protein
MAHARNGNEAKARVYCDRAVHWTRANRYGDFELHFFDDEAATIPPLDAPRIRLQVTDRPDASPEKMPATPHDPMPSKHL